MPTVTGRAAVVLGPLATDPIGAEPAHGAPS